MANKPSASNAYVLTTREPIHEDWARRVYMDADDGYELIAGPVAWTGKADMAPGEPLAIYVAEPISGIAWIGRVISSSSANPSRTAERGRAEYWVWIEMVPLRAPITLSEMQSDDVLAGWGPVQQKFQGRSRRCAKDESWDRLIELAYALNPEVAPLIADLLESEWDPAIDEAADAFTWTPGVDSPYPFITEADLQAALHSSLIDRDDDSHFLEPREMTPPIDLPALEPRLSSNCRGDLLLGSEEDGQSDITLIETKQLARVDAVDQVLRYKPLAESLTGLPVTPVVIAHAFSSGALAAAIEQDVRCGRVRWGTEDEDELVLAAIEGLRASGEDSLPNGAVAKSIWLEFLDQHGRAYDDAPFLIDVATWEPDDEVD